MARDSLSTASRKAAVLLALVGVCACGGGKPAKAPEPEAKAEEPAPKWETSGETEPPPKDPPPAAEAASAGTTAGPKPMQSDDELLHVETLGGSEPIKRGPPPASAPAAAPNPASARAARAESTPPAAPAPARVEAGDSSVSATIGGRSVTFRRARINGNPREGFTLVIREQGSGTKGPEVDLALHGSLGRGRAIGATLTFIQVPDEKFFGGVRSITCGGQGKLTLDVAPTIPKGRIKEDQVDAGEVTGKISANVKCTGADAKEFGSFALSGSVNARVTVTRSED